MKERKNNKPPIRYSMSIWFQRRILFFCVLLLVVLLFLQLLRAKLQYSLHVVRNMIRQMKMCDISISVSMYLYMKLCMVFFFVVVCYSTHLHSLSLKSPHTVNNTERNTEWNGREIVWELMHNKVLAIYHQPLILPNRIYIQNSMDMTVKSNTEKKKIKSTQTLLSILGWFSAFVCT